MPQMSPMSWLVLFSLFSLIYLNFYMINYYNSQYIIQSNYIKTEKKNKINWKW